MKKTLLLAGLMTATSITVLAQDRTRVTGVVKDDKGEPLMGVQVIPVGHTAAGTVTDLNGKYTVMVPKGAKELSFTYIGYAKQTVTLGGQTTFNITMREENSHLEEVIVTAYGGRVKRNKVTNAITSVKQETLSVGLFANPAQALSGAVPGLRVVQSSGAPGAVPAIVLRGGTNFDGSGAPLIVVDGQIRGGMNDINPDDIEDMQVLKDAGSTAIYGARASNGVILITTKSGKAGRSEINFKAKAGFNFLNTPYEFVGAEDYIRLMRTAYATGKFTTKEGKDIFIAPQGNLTGAGPLGLGNDVLSNTAQWNIAELTDANKSLLDKGWSQMVDPVTGKNIIYKGISPRDYNIQSSYSEDYNLSMTGGNDKGTYYAGFGYNHQKGLPITSYYKRMSALLNGSYKLRPWLTSTTNFNYNRANWQSMPAKQTSEANYFGRIMSVPATARYEDEEGNHLMGPNLGDGNQSFQSDRFIRDNQTDKFNFTQALDFNILKNLRLTLKGAWFYSETYNEAFNKDYQSNANGTYERSRSSSAFYDRELAQTYNAVLNYNFDIKKHSFDLMAGTEYLDNYTRGFSASGSGAPTDDFMDLSYTTTDEKKRNIDSWHTRHRILSYFGRINYDYADKYLISAVFRSDGYSSLLGENRWGFFPGISAGWVMTNEKWFRDKLPFVSFAKLRASYGLNGNASGIGAYTLQGSYNSVKYNGQTGFTIGSLYNPGLRWEKTATAEFGLDMSFLNNRLTVNLAYFNRLTTDKYAAFELPATTGFSSITNNNGKYRNTGLELEVSGKIIETKDFSWSASGNITYIKNKIVSLPHNGEDRNRQGGSQIYTGRKVEVDGKLVDEKIWVGGYQEGQEPGLMITYKANGIYQSLNDIPGDLVVETGNINGKKLYGPNAWNNLTAAEQERNLPLQPGDIKLQDVNGDNKIDQYDQVVIGNTRPRYTGGLNTNLRYKNLSLSVRTDFALDFWIYDNQTSWFLGSMQGTYAPTTDVFNTWTPENPGAKYPRYVWADQLQTANYYRGSTLFAYKGDYLALREISLAYSLPKAWANKLFCQAISVSATAQNLGYLTAAKTVATPEGGGSTGSGYPLPRTLVFGLNVTF